MSDKFIPLSVPNLKGNELKYVSEAIETEWVSTAGPFVEEFEQKIADYVGTKGAVSCQNGTSGIHTALLSLEIKMDDVVLVPTLTFIAAVNPVKYVNAIPVFMDCDDSLCMNPLKLQKYCEENCDYIDGKLIDRDIKKQVKAIIVVHVFGNMADMEKIMNIAQKYNLLVIEDATEALGTFYQEGVYKGKFAGTIGDVGIYSFNGNKIITTGGGGMIVTNNMDCLSAAKHLTTQAKSDVLNFYHDEIGYNYRMTNMQAAMGIAQLEQLEKFIDIKNKNYRYYLEKLKKPEQLLGFRENVRSNHWFYSILTDEKQELIKALQNENIQARPVWGLIADQKPYRGEKQYYIDKAKFYWEKIVNIPCSTNLEKQQIDKVTEVVNRFI